MCPPGTDQTGRGPQQWRVVLPTLCQSQPVKPLEERAYGPSSSSNPLAGRIECLNFGSKLARGRPFFPPHRERRGDEHNVRTVSQTSRLLTLPVEILENVFEILDKSGAINLGLTCTFALRLAIEHIDRDIRKHSGPWADQPLAILGNYLRNLPPPLFDNGLAYESVKRPDLIQMDPDNGSSFIPRRFHHWPARQFYWETRTRFQHLQNEAQPGLASWLDALDKPEPPGVFADYPQRVIIKSALLQADILECSFSSKPHFEKSGYYLRNLTGKELVRLCVCDGLDKAHVRLSSINSELTEKYMLDDIMLVQTRWSDFGPENWGKMRYFAADPRGTWAGSRFDIVTVKSHQERMKQADTLKWKDVTEGVLIQAAWEHDYQAGLTRLGSLQVYNDPTRTIWSSYMGEVRSKLRSGEKQHVCAEEILEWSAKIDELCHSTSGTPVPNPGDTLDSKFAKQVAPAVVEVGG